MSLALVLWPALIGLAGGWSAPPLLGPPLHPLAPLSPDSQGILVSARHAQAAFEWTRRLNLPREVGHSGGRCEERIGRFCYWQGDSDGPPPAEPRAIRAARDRLLRALEHAAALLPGDGWIAGQRVRYLIEADRLEAALRAAQDCRAARWWCEVLGGLALHVAVDFAAADTTFDLALRDMPATERCRWTDISLLLAGQERAAYRRLDCAAREAFAAHWWWLAKPLLSLPGNDRRSEHFARVTMAEIDRDATTTYGLRWGDDLREMQIRFGWPVYWTGQPSSSPNADAAVVGHERSPGFHFGPGPHALADGAHARSDDWAVDAPRARERYAPRYAVRFVSLPHQVAVFQRGDSALVVVAYDLSRDTLFADRPVQARLVLASEGRAPAATRHDTEARGTDVLVATAPADSLLLSLEVVDAGAPRVARARYKLGDLLGAGRVSLSDVLLFHPADPLPASVADALSLAYGSNRVPASRPLGLFWEVYGLKPAGDTVTTSLALVEEQGGWLRRTAAALGLASRRRAVRLRWDETPEPRQGAASRALALDLSGIEPGRYRIELSVTAPGADPITALREIEVVRR